MGVQELGNISGCDGRESVELGAGPQRGQAERWGRSGLWVSAIFSSKNTAAKVIKERRENRTIENNREQFKWTH